MNEFFKALLDIESTDKKPEFLDLFYSTVLQQFVDFIGLDKDNELLSEYKGSQQVALANSMMISRSLILQVMMKCV
ncbi:MAG: hypothetical protein ACMG6E_05665 [Candidatus Roizmanbacteria bacterium]